jgi:hypothetical protein
VRWQGFAVGFLGLVGLEALVSSTNGVAAFGGIANGVGNLAQKVISPLVPAFNPVASTTTPNSTPSPSSPANPSPSSPTSPFPSAIPAAPPIVTYTPPGPGYV